MMARAPFGLPLRSPPVLAHGFGIRYDLPVPLLFYLLGAGAAVAITFAVLGLLLRGGREPTAYPRFSLLRVPGLRGMSLGPVPRVVLGTIGVGALVAIFVTGLLGSTDATGNPAEYLLWIYFWAGTVVLSGLVGNLFALLNPWSALYDVLHWIRRRPPGRGWVRYPDTLGIWPAVAGYFIFAWFELASGLSAKPRFLSGAAILYSGYTWLMMGLVGRDRWLGRGELFSVLFRFVGAFAPVEIRASDPTACAACSSHCEVGQTECVDCGECFRSARARDVCLRPWSVGILTLSRVGWDIVAFVVLTLSSLAFDGISATPPWVSLVTATGANDSLGSFGGMLFRTGGLIAVTLAFLAIFVVVARLVGAVGGIDGAAMRTTTLLAYTLIPIALVYNAAHNYSYMAIQGQGLIPILADPLHRGAHLLPTAGYQVNFAVADAVVVWWIQIVLIVAGHMLAVHLAHVRSLSFAVRGRGAIRSQLPMLGLMVLYTMTSLWILAQPITEAS